ncbi:hypothetical protein RD110_10990 [Rhodoferax koreense]|uniref:Uncharacterized protein n=1 Tax=Rhodoferax koreensis TaxID=1842727 RepID=A0A1P8JV82_9BURK|nr:hypothetical protein [Rhodoferax koreense]APW37652.1 hypothetical protein RD110_10990 [Rhodoferax koreense]
MSGLQSSIHVQDGRMVVSNTQDCTPIAEYAKSQHNIGAHGTSEMKHAARIPMVMVEKYINDNGISFSDWCKDKAHIKRMLQDPALAHFRIWPGAI